MDPRAKQRLTGAVILVALFVLLVPELLTGPRHAQAPTSTDEEGLRRYTIDLEAPPAGGMPSAQPPLADTGRAQPGEAAAVEPDTPVASAQAPADAGSVEPTPDPEPASPPARATAAAAPARATESPRATSEAPGVARSSQPAAAPAANAARGNFVVQLGSFRSRDNAERLVRDMNARGFTSFIAPITSNGRELYRVRVGPTPDRASAEALAARLKRAGQSGSIVPLS